MGEIDTAGYISRFPGGVSSRASKGAKISQVYAGEMQKGSRRSPSSLILPQRLLLCDSTLANLLGLKTSLRVERLSEQGPAD